MSGPGPAHDLLERFSPRPAPPELRTGVLEGARREAARRRLLSPGLRMVLAACLAIAALAVLIDLPLEGRRQKQMDAELNLKPGRLFSPGLRTGLESAELPDEHPYLRVLSRFRKETALAPENKESPSIRLTLEEIKRRLHER